MVHDRGNKIAEYLLKLFLFVSFLIYIFLYSNAFAQENSETETATGKFPLDINKATLDEIYTLPLPEDLLLEIYDYRQYIGFFRSIYEIRTLPGFDQDAFEKVKSLIKIFPPEKDPEIERLDKFYYKIEDWYSTEGTNEGVVDLWVDLAMDPIDANTCTYEDLANLQSVSPLDAAAIIEQRKRFGSFSRLSSLRSSPGLTNWGYRNVRNFLRFEDEKKAVKKLNGHYQVRMTNSLYEQNFEDILKGQTLSNEELSRKYDQNENYKADSLVNWWELLNLDNPVFGVTHKLRLGYGDHYKGGAIYFRNVGEEDEMLPVIKGYAGIEDFRLGPLNLERLYFGNYTLAFGQGVIFESTDYFKPRKSGYSYDKRYTGVLGDFTKNQEFTLFGSAAELSFWKLKGILFYSDDKKDAFLNEEGDVQSLVIMSPRIPNSLMEEQGYQGVIDVLREKTYGGNLRYYLNTGTYVGVTGYESIYDRFFNPDTRDHITIITTDGQSKLKLVDNEYFDSYHGDGKYRRVFGGEFQAMWKRLVFQGEYGSLVHGGEAYVVNGYFQMDDLDMLVLYRNLDLDYDNPYCRAFSNYNRYKGTILEDEYYLINNIYGFLYDNSPYPQAEEGVYFSSRYKFSRALTLNAEYDIWERKADGAHQQRLVSRISYQPIYPMRFALRHKFQARNPDEELTLDKFVSNEDIVTLILNLSNYNRVGLSYTTSSTKWPPRGRLSGDAQPDGKNPLQGNTASPSHAIGFFFENNFTENLTLKGDFSVYKGFIWTFEDRDFVTMDGDAMRSWISISDRLSDRTSLYFKMRYDKGFTGSGLDVRKYNDPYGVPIESDHFRDENISYKFQMDVSW